MTRRPFRVWCRGAAQVLSIAVAVLAGSFCGAEDGEAASCVHPVTVAGAPRCLKPGDAFQDCPQCPQMVVVPAGRFVMGASEHESALSSEKPPHEVTIGQPLAVGKVPVTFAEWDACQAEGGCGGAGQGPEDEGWGRGRRPVIHVSWDEARSYADWLSRKTGQTYRLLSEAEYEYAARAGTATAFSTGASITQAEAQFDADRTAETGSFAANAFGLHDMQGNVWEWTQDCWHDDYTAAPADGSAWLSPCPDAQMRVVRGGTWGSSSEELRSAYRQALATSTEVYDVGFRVARVLAP